MTYQNILSKQASILNEKDKQIDRNEVILKNNKMKLDTHKKEKLYYNEKMILIVTSTIIELGIVYTSSSSSINFRKID